MSSEISQFSLDNGRNALYLGFRRWVFSSLNQIAVVNLSQAGTVRTFRPFAFLRMFSQQNKKYRVLSDLSRIICILRNDFQAVRRRSCVRLSLCRETRQKFFPCVACNSAASGLHFFNQRNRHAGTCRQCFFIISAYFKRRRQ